MDFQADFLQARPHGSGSAAAHRPAQRSDRPLLVPRHSRATDGGVPHQAGV